MSAESNFDRESRLITMSYWGSLTADEFIASLQGEASFFDGMEGRVIMMVNVTDLILMPPTLLTYARSAAFTRYQPLEYVLVGHHPLFRAMVETLNKVMGITLTYCRTRSEAIEYIKRRMTE